MPLRTISAVICTRNRAAILADCLLSLAGQEHNSPDYEIIVVDDGSTDNTRDVVQRIAEENAATKIRYLRQEHGGVNAARNRAVREAKGDFILFFDDDQVAPPGYLIKVTDALDSDPLLDGVGGPYRDYGESKLRTCSRCNLAAHSVEKDKNGAFARLLGGNMTLRKAAFLKVGMFDEALSGMASARGDETEWFHRARGHRFLFDDTLWVWHRRDYMNLWSLMRHSFRQGTCSPLNLNKVGEEYRCNFFRLFRHVGHAAFFMCARGLALAAHESGAIWAIIRKRNIV